jgi:simple sugar transport system ATP-binding protein
MYKRFPGVVAVNQVDFSLKEGEIHGLVGENGAGKSTLMNILYGLIKPDHGSITIRGEKVTNLSPQKIAEFEVGMVHQHFMLVPSLTVLENIILGNPSKDRIVIDSRKAVAKASAIIEKYNLQVDLNAKIDQLSVGQKQRVEIIKSLFRDARILIFDEPTAVLTVLETEEFLNILRQLRADGCSIIFITHKLKEVMAVADNITVMRKGAVTGNVSAAGTTEKQLATYIVGREMKEPKNDKPFEPGGEVLRIENAYANNDAGIEMLKGLSLTVREGEILGVAGVEGNGQSELSEVVAGLRKLRAGEIFFREEAITRANVRRRRRKGISHIPEDRLKTGVAKECTVAENMALNRYMDPPFSKHGVMNNRQIHAFAERLIETFQIKVPNPEYKVATLSGGNMQKVVFARETEMSPDLLISAQPTRGVDIGAIEYIHSELLRLRNEGRAILLISAELSEIRALSDRIIVIYEGEIVGEFKTSEITDREIGLYMTGSKRADRKGEVSA